MSIKIYDENNTLKYELKRVLSASYLDKLSGERTLSFSTLTDKVLDIYPGFYCVYNNDYYSIVRVVKKLNNGMPITQIECEHISYKLNNEEYNINYFIHNGTIIDGLTKLLAGTPFSLGTMNVPAGDVKIVYSGGKLSRRACIMNFIHDCGCEIVYDGFKIGMTTHRGSIARKALMDGKNVTNLSVTTDSRQNCESYTVSLYKKIDLEAGDEVTIDFRPMNILVNTRIISIEYNPFDKHEVSIEVGDYVPNIVNTTTEHMSAMKQEFQAADGALLSKIEMTEGTVSELSQTMTEVTERVKTAEGDVSEMKVNVQGVTAKVESHDGDISQLQVTAQGLTTKVEGVEGDVSSLKQTTGEITAQVSNKADAEHGDETSTFGWSLKSDGFKLVANHQAVMIVDTSGLEVKGKVTATEGSIADFNIGTNGIYKGVTSFDDTEHSGVYVGTDGIRLGKNFTVDKDGIVSAKGLTLNLTPEQKVELKGETGEQGPQGEKGDTGAQGPKGDTGAKGDTGSQGPKGDTGSQGPQGVKGDTGATGPQGEKGDTGAKGDTGSQGPKGDTGAQGPKGDTGAKGDKGDTGAKGDKGDKGDTGATGPAGSDATVNWDNICNALAGSKASEGTARGIYTNGGYIYVMADAIDATWINSGLLSALQGKIGGFTIDSNRLYAGTPGSNSGIELSSVSLVGYKSNNQGVQSSQCVSKIIISKATNLTIFIRSYGETNYDYTIASKPNAASVPTTYTSTYTQAHTRGISNSGKTLESYTKVEYTGLKAGDFIYISYIKDGSQDTGDDTGYLLVPNTSDFSVVSNGGTYSFVRDSNLDLNGASIKVGSAFSVDSTGAIKSTSGTIGNLKISTSGLTYEGSSWDAKFQIGSESTDSRMPRYAIFSRTQRIDDCIMGFKSNSYGENYWVEFKPDGYCTYMSTDADDAVVTGKIPYNHLSDVCWLNTPLGSAHYGNKATCPQIIVFNYTVGSSTYATINLSAYGINEILGAAVTEKDTSSTGSNNQWFSISGLNLTIYNTTTKSKTFSVIAVGI